MSVTHRGSISIEIPEAGGTGTARWARVDLEDFFWIGRCSICNLRIQGDTQVSRLHATIHREGDGYRLTDMQSRNGTVVNGRKVASCPLVPGDRVRVGQTLFEFEPDFAEDTFFKEGTSRNIGAAEVELKSFPSSLMMQVPEVLARPVAEAPTLREAFVARPVAEQRVPPGGLAAQRRPAPAPAPSSLDAFLTVVADRLASEVQAGLALVHLPRVGARPPFTIARGMKDGQLTVLPLPVVVVDRVGRTFTPLSFTQPPPEEGERLVWRGEALEARLTDDARSPRGLGIGSGFSIALPRVGRAGTKAPPPEQARELAFIHVDDAAQGRHLARLVDEIGSAVSASAIRFLERE